jgi:PleD family two-component response regulator
VRDPGTGLARPRVLVLDPDERSRTRLREILAGEFLVDASEEWEGGLRETGLNRYQVALVSRDWPGGEGTRVADALRHASQDGLLRLLFIANRDSMPLELAVGAADDFVERPVDRIETLARVRTAVRRHRLCAMRCAAQNTVPHLGLRSVHSRRPPQLPFAA